MLSKIKDPRWVNFKSNATRGTLVAVGVAIIGVYFIFLSHAATPTVSFEPENGTLSSGATVGSDATASGGKYIAFGGSSGTPTPPPPPPPTSGSYGPVSMSAPSSAYVTPDQYGAVGDGNHNDTSAVQSALNAAAGKILWLPAGKTYLCTSSLSMPASNITIEGAGPTSVLKFNWFYNGGTGSGGSSDLHSGNTGSNVNLLNFVVDGGNPGVPSGPNTVTGGSFVPAIHLGALNGFTIKHVEVRNTSGVGITYHGSQHGTIQYNYVHNTGRDGITAFGSGVSDMVIDNNLVKDVGDDAIAIDGLVLGSTTTVLPTRIQITNNVIEGWDPNGLKLGRGIALVGASDVVVQNNKISYPYGTGILSTGCNSHFCSSGSQNWQNTNIKILNNTIDHAFGGSTPGGIYLTATNNSTVTGNIITNTTPAIVNNVCTNCTIQ